MTPADLESLARRVETENPTPELTALVLTAFGCESEPGSAPEPLTRVEDAHAFRPDGWFLWGLWEPCGQTGWETQLRWDATNERVYGAGPSEARSRTAANLRALAWEIGLDAPHELG